ncbi:MAG: D-2-hydroxyacid dehydrogenase [Lactobacillales bacterium]|nr:D-2-hydroxyacid dehydrogenase [Lactobacillales bacterium]
MKIFIYAIGKLEQIAADKWAEEHQVEIGTSPEFFSRETVELAKGYNAISFQQMLPIHDEETYKILAENGTKFISTRSAGIDILNLDYIKKYHLKAVNVPVYSPRAIAEFALTLTMNLLRNIPELVHREEKGNYNFDGLIGNEIHEMTVGVVGTGHIGFAAAEIFHALGAKVIAYDKFPKPAEVIENVLTYKDSLESLVKEADIVTIHAPYLEENHHLFNAAIFNQMKDGALLINTARGPIVDTEALLAALKSGKLGGAGLDAVEDEENWMNVTFKSKDDYPKTLRELQEQDNVLVTPHMAFYTKAASRALITNSLDSLYDLETTGTSNVEISLD